MCVVKEKDMGMFQMSEMSELISLKIGIKFATSRYMGYNIPVYRNAISDHISCKIH